MCMSQAASSNYFSMMLQRVMLEAQTGPGGDILMTKANYFANQPDNQLTEETAQKRKNLESTIQRVKGLLEKKGQVEPEVIVVEESGTSSESGDDVDVVGGLEVNLDDVGLIPKDPVQTPRPTLVARPTTHPNECCYCSKTLASPSLLREHIAIMHLNERNFACQMCSARFGRRGGLRRHMQMVHSNHIYKCTYDGCQHPGYKSPQALQAHVRSVHTKERPFTCEICSKAFVRKNDLAMHIKTHNKEPSFSCICGTRFRRVVYLKKHQKSCFVAMEAAGKGLPTEVRNYEEEERDLNFELVKLAQEELIKKDIQLDAQQFFPFEKQTPDDVQIVGVRQPEGDQPSKETA